MNLTDKAKNLLDWNSKNLLHNTEITNEKIAALFAENFVVIANGRTHQANYDNYREFLYQFKASIKSISYEVHDYIEAETAVTVPMTATIVRTSEDIEKFEAILILKFDEKGKIILWHEIYIELKST